MQPLLVERGANRADHAVDHAAGGDDVGARLAVRHGDAREDLERLVVEHVAVGVEEAAVAVVRVLAEAHVRHDDELGRASFSARIACWTTPSSAWLSLP